MRPIRTAADIDDLLRGAKALAVISAWHDLGCFAALANGPQPLASLPGDPRAIAITAPVLKHLGLIRGDETRVGLTEAGAELLAAGSLPTAKNFEFLEGLGQMGRIVKEGGPLNPDDVTDGGVRLHDIERSHGFLDYLHDRSAESSAACFEWLAPELPAQARVLDVGGGHGRYVRRFVDAGHQGALFDFAPIVEYARGRHGEALRYFAGNFRDADAAFGGPYDLIFLSNIVHGEPSAENAALMRRLAACLAPGGRIVIKDMFIDAHGANSELAVFFGLTMLYHTRRGESPTVANASAWLRAAGLDDIALINLGSFELLSGRAPQ